MGYTFVEGTRVIPNNIIVRATCDACKAELEYDEKWECVWGSLPIQVVGGYGMYFDDIDSGDIELLLCQQCADRLCEEWSCFKEAIRNSCCCKKGQSCCDTEIEV